MGILVIDEKVRAQLFEAVVWARLNPLSWELIQQHLPGNQGSFELKLADRKDNLGWRPPSRKIPIPVGYRLNVSCEEHPVGLVLHISMSSPTPKRTVPRPEAMKMLAEELEKIGVIKKGAPCSTWIEEFAHEGKFAGRAINMVWLLEGKEKWNSPRAKIS